MKTVRCAIYTRKSSDEGLEQSFNSLDAQREACAAYILSQASEGWVAVKEQYDDGGLSGGTMERPALKRLLADVAAHRVDIIVVYKVDRLTRSLLDFAKLVEAFDAAGTSFVSVTQSFNTTTSMGRLTLNMLLSFAQFEREVTAERIRDKIAASKAKGMWMGGIAPLGYQPAGRSLKPVEQHACLVRHIYERYLALSNVRTLAEELEREGRQVPRRVTVNGKPHGGGRFARGHLYSILRNPLYTGKVVHKGQTYEGQHEGIVGPELWERVQRLLTENRQGERKRGRTASPSLLAGKVVDQAGEPLITVHASKTKGEGSGQRRYRYYVSRALQEGRSKEGWRLPAGELDGVVCERLAQLFDDPMQLSTTANLRVPPHAISTLQERCEQQATALRKRERQPVDSLVERVRIEDSRIVIICSSAAFASTLQLETLLDLPPLEVIADVRLRRSGRALRLVHNNGLTRASDPDPALLRLVLLARRWWGELRQAKIDVSTLAKREGVQDSYVTRVVRLAFLSPKVVEAIVRGNQPVTLTASVLRASSTLPMNWSEQGQSLLN